MTEPSETPRGDPLRPDLNLAPPRSAKEARRQARRARAAATWDAELSSPGRRLRAWVSMLAADHGVLRLVYLNLHRVGTRAFRAAQPTPGQIARLARREGLRSVISLRGGVLFGSYPLEREACARLGIDFRRAVLRSRDLPSREELLALIALMREVETPVLFHCKSGADRAGFMAALWLIVMEGRPAAEAAGQLALRYGHLSRGPTGILDLFFAEAAAAEARGVPFLRWAESDYDREALRERFRASGRGGGAAGFVTDRLLRRE